MDQQIRRGSWSVEEDDRLLELVSIEGPSNWAFIASSLGSRTAKQCRERYHQSLKPGLISGPITPEEGARIEQLVAVMSRRWSEIANHIPGRSDNKIKNWWNGNENRRRRRLRRLRELSGGEGSQLNAHLQESVDAHEPPPTSQPRTDAAAYPRILPPPMESFPGVTRPSLTGRPLTPGFTKPCLSAGFPDPRATMEGDNRSERRLISPPASSSHLWMAAPADASRPRDDDLLELPSIRSSGDKAAAERPLHCFNTTTGEDCHSEPLLHAGAVTDTMPTVPGTPEFGQRSLSQRNSSIGSTRDPRLQNRRCCA